MDSETVAARKRLARETFGKELSTEQVIALGPRIDAAARNVALLNAWEENLGQTEPSAVYIASTSGNNGEKGT